MNTVHGINEQNKRWPCFEKGSPSEVEEERVSSQTETIHQEQ